MRLLKVMIYSQSSQGMKEFMSALSEENDSPVVHINTQMDYNAIAKLAELGSTVNGR